MKSLSHPQNIVPFSLRKGAGAGLDSLRSAPQHPGFPAAETQPAAAWHIVLNASGSDSS
jgi:hypothetical protein